MKAVFLISALKYLRIESKFDIDYHGNKFIDLFINIYI